MWQIWWLVWFLCEEFLHEFMSCSCASCLHGSTARYHCYKMDMRQPKIYQCRHMLHNTLKILKKLTWSELIICKTCIKIICQQIKRTTKDQRQPFKLSWKSTFNGGWYLVLHFGNFYLWLLKYDSTKKYQAQLGDFFGKFWRWPLDPFWLPKAVVSLISWKDAAGAYVHVN